MIDVRWQSALCRSQIELIFSQPNLSGLRHAPNPDAVNLDTPRPERAAQLDSSPAQAPGESDLDAVREVEENLSFGPR